MICKFILCALHTHSKPSITCRFLLGRRTYILSKWLTTFFSILLLSQLMWWQIGGGLGTRASLERYWTSTNQLQKFSFIPDQTQCCYLSFLSVTRETKTLQWNQPQHPITPGIRQQKEPVWPQQTGSAQISHPRVFSVQSGWFASGQESEFACKTSACSSRSSV